ncbi:MAG TPA: DNRLRE domain-containing protein [Gemmataceae bacterium]|nr:DNRLRE domain-containing protein [Gemmataceae bacterium]
MTDELKELCAAAVEGRLTEEQSRRLEEIARTDADARRECARFLHLHAVLAWAAGEPRHLSDDAGGHSDSSPRPADAAARRSRPLVKWAGWAVAAGLLIAVGVQALRPARGSAEFARLEEAKACKWDGGSLPTEPGARLGAGRLRLAEGVARIVFDNGAEVRLEGPADLELVRADRCVLHAGRLIARVPEPAHGFTVLTPAAELKDYGTEFGVSVADGKTADVQVFEGRVDVTHRSTGRVEQLLTGRGLRFTLDAVADLGPTAEVSRAAGPVPPFPPGGRVLTLTTATGNGKDGYVASQFHPQNRSDVLILVKSMPATKSAYQRKGYLGFDLTELGGAKVRDAQLSLTLVPSEMGFASEVPDATFSVYGLTDESLDGWDEKTLAWANAPANVPADGVGVDPLKTVLIGQFTVEQGVGQAVRSVGGPDLASFLNRDTNRTATFIVVRDTLGSGRNCLVHGFASRRHPTLPPPTLRVALDEK